MMMNFRVGMSYTDKVGARNTSSGAFITGEHVLQSSRSIDSSHPKDLYEF
jgi:hypothetical protein